MEIVHFEEKKTIKQLVSPNSNKTILDHIVSELAKDDYNFLVTSENLVFAKEKMAELNKSSKFIDTFRKNKVASESEDIELFKKNIKEYLSLIDAKRDQIKKDVEVFESEQKALITKELSLYADELVNSYGIRFEFNSVDTSDLILLGSVTSKGALTKKAKDSIESRVLSCKNKQDKYDMRLMQLENLSHRSGLASPLTIVHVQGIINLDNDIEYEARLNELIASEMARQEMVMESVAKKAREDAQREAQQQLIQQQNKIKNQLSFNPNDIDIKYGNELISKFTYYDFSVFGSLSEFAREFANEQILKLRTIVSGLTAKEELEKKVACEVSHEVIEEPKFSTPVQDIEDDKKVVYIDVKLQFKVKKSVSELKILDKVTEMLGKAGFSESIFSLGVAK